MSISCQTSSSVRTLSANCFLVTQTNSLAFHFQLCRWIPHSGLCTYVRKGYEAAAAAAAAAKKAKASDLKKEADALVAAGDYAEAAQKYGLAKELDQSDEELPTLQSAADAKAQAKILKHKGDTQSEHSDAVDDALASYDQALKLDPEDAAGALPAREDLLARIKNAELAKAAADADAAAQSGVPGALDRPDERDGRPAPPPDAPLEGGHRRHGRCPAGQR